MAEPAIPVIDIGPYRAGDPAGTKRVADAVGAACERIGFLVIAGHGIPDALVRQSSTCRSASSTCRSRTSSLVVVAALGQGTAKVMVAIGVSLVPTFVRLVRGDVLTVKENVYVEAARARLRRRPPRVAPRAPERRRPCHRALGEPATSGPPPSRVDAITRARRRQRGRAGGRRGGCARRPG